MKDRLTYPEYLQGLALFTVAKKYYEKSREMEREMSSLLGADDGYAECVSDAIGSEDDFDKALAKQGIKVDH